MTTPVLDLEQEIMNCWRVVDDIDLLYGNLMDGNTTIDDVGNILLGMKHLYQMRFEKCFNRFEDVMRERREARKSNLPEADGDLSADIPLENTPKYKFTEATFRTSNGIMLRQIQALKTFGDVRIGDLGGWIETEYNLSQSDTAWVSGNALVYGNAQVFGDAQVSGNAWVFGDAQVSGDAQVYGNAWVSAKAQVFGNAQVSGNAQVFGDAQVSGDAHV